MIKEEGEEEEEEDLETLAFSSQFHRPSHSFSQFPLIFLCLTYPFYTYIIFSFILYIHLSHNSHIIIQKFIIPYFNISKYHKSNSIYIHFAPPLTFQISLALTMHDFLWLGYSFILWLRLFNIKYIFLRIIPPNILCLFWLPKILTHLLLDFSSF